MCGTRLVIRVESFRYLAGFPELSIFAIVGSGSLHYLSLLFPGPLVAVCCNF